MAKTAKRAKPAKSAKRRNTKKNAKRKKAHSASRKARITKVAGRSRRKPAKRVRAAQAQRKKAPRRPRPARKARPHLKSPRLDRARRLFEDVVTTPPSSLDMNRHGSAARTGRAELAESLRDHATLGSAITAGDVDASVESAYFSGDEAPGGDNPTPDQDVVDEIGRAVGVEYDDSEELKGSDKIVKRDRHRWELDPASSEDYRDRK